MRNRGTGLQTAQRIELLPESISAPARVLRTDAPDPAQRAAWDALVDGTPGTDVTQLSAWATVRGQAGYRPEYLLAYRADRLVGGALVLRRRVAEALRVSYLPYGPVLAAGQLRRAEVVDALLDELTELAHTDHLTFVQPPEGAGDVSAALLARGFRRSDAGIAPSGSYRVDLTPSLSEIRSRFSKRVKYWTNQWPYRGVTVREGGADDIPLLLDLMADTGARHGFAPPSEDYVRTLYRELGDHAAIFVGQVDGVPVSADLVTVCAGMVRGRLGGFRSTGPAGKLSVPAACRWELMQWGRARGLRWLDFGGLPEQMLTDLIDRGIHSSDEWPSAYRSKLSWGGAAFRYPPAVELVRPAALRLGYDVLRSSAGGQRLLHRAQGSMRGFTKSCREDKSDG